MHPSDVPPGRDRSQTIQNYWNFHYSRDSEIFTVRRFLERRELFHQWTKGAFRETNEDDHVASEARKYPPCSKSWAEKVVPRTCRR